MNKHLWLAAAALFLSACASQPPEPPATAESASQAIAAAETAVKRADSVGFAWRDSESLVAQAKDALQKQEFATAVQLAKKAELQGNMAYKQYEDQNGQPATSTANR